jgi:MFS family permease
MPKERRMSEMPMSPISQTSSTTASDNAGLAAGYARYVFWLMFVISGLNYLDRFVFIGLAPYIQSDLKFSYFQIGLLSSAFLLVYTIVAMPLGFLADRVARKVIVSAGVIVWSIATVFTGLVSSFLPMLGVRSILGVGEGSYFPAGTPLLAAFYPPSRRAAIMARWGVGTLIGAAIGVLAASFFTHGSDWRYAFFFTGVPGFIAAVFMLRLREKSRHEEDPIAEKLVGSGPSFWQRLRAYLGVPTIRVILGLHALGFFGITAVSSFLTIYLFDAYGNSPVTRQDALGNVIGQAPAPFPHAGLTKALVPILGGGLVLLGGVFGNLYGGILADRLSRRFSGARVLTGGLGFLLAAPCVVIAIGSRFVLPAMPFYRQASEGTQVLLGVAILAIAGLAASFFLNVYNGPTTAALLDVIPAAERAGAGGAELALAHLLGDVWAATAIGALADVLVTRTGTDWGGLGLALLVTCPVALVLSGIIGIWGSRFYARDVAALGTSAEAMLGVAAGARAG